MPLVYPRSFLDETERLEAAVRSAGGGMTLPRKEHINTCITRLKSNNLWSGIDVLQLYAVETTQGALINVRQPGTYNGSLVDAPTFTADRGYTTDGSNDAINTGFINQGNYTQDSASWSLWSLTSGQLATGSGSGSSGNPFGFLNPRNASDVIRYCINNIAIVSSSSANTDGTGFYSVVRTASNLTTVYKNGVSFGTDATASSGEPDTNNYHVGYNIAAASFTARQFACAVLGAGRTAAQELALYNILRAYMTAVGVP